MGRLNIGCVDVFQGNNIISKVNKYNIKNKILIKEVFHFLINIDRLILWW